MFLKDMKRAVQYIVTESSECETFQEGDLVGLYEDGILWNKCAGGFMDPEEISELMRRVKVEPKVVGTLKDLIAALREKGYSDTDLIEALTNIE